MSPVTAHIGLGSNLEEPKAQVERAFEELDQLPQTRLLARSPLYRSEPVGPPQPDFINAVARIETTLAPLALLDELQRLEQRHRRVRLEHWGPRTLDLDLLLYDAQTIDEPRLRVPHPEMANRPFVLYPLADIDPDMTLPSGGSLASLLVHCPYEGLERLTEDRQHRES